MPRAKASNTKRVSKSGTKRRSSGRAAARERIAPRGDARYVRRDEAGRFDESDDVGRSLRADRKVSAKKKVQSGFGDRGDRRVAAKKKTSR